MKRQFYMLHKKYPEVTPTPEVMFGNYEGEPWGEIAMRWHNLPDPTPRLEVFSDSWPVLVILCQDVIDALVLEDSSLTPDGFAALLTNLGFEDTT